MSNWKALGIEKEMNEAFKSFGEHDTEQFLALQKSCYFENPYVTKRNQSNYCTVEVWKCKSDNWWYRDLIGLQFFCEIHFRELPNGIKTIRKVTGVKLTQSKKIVFRCFDPEDIFLI